MLARPLVKALFWGSLAAVFLLTLYFTIVSLISGARFAQDQFGQFWYFVVSLALGFGIQVGLYVYLKQIIKLRAGAGPVVAVTGATSTVAMVSCCAHYLANIAPLLGIAGALSIISQYQVKLFWVGILFNLGGIAYIANKIIKYKKAY